MKVLLAVDGSAYTERMLAYIGAHDELLKGDVEFTLLTVVPGIPPHAARFLPEATCRATTSRRPRRCSSRSAPTSRSRAGAPSSATATACRPSASPSRRRSGDFDLVVLGSHGHSALGNVLLGSVATRVLAALPRPGADHPLARDQGRGLHGHRPAAREPRRAGRRRRRRVPRRVRARFRRGRGPRRRRVLAAPRGPALRRLRHHHRGGAARCRGRAAVEVNAASARARVSWDPARTRPSALVDAVRAAGYEAVPDTAAAARALRRAERAPGAVAAVRRRLLRDAGDDARDARLRRGPGDLAPDLQAAARLGQLAADACRCWCSRPRPFFAGAWRALRQRRIGMDVPVALGIARRLRRQQRRRVRPRRRRSASEVYFDSLTMFVALPARRRAGSRCARGTAPRRRSRARSTRCRETRRAAARATAASRASSAPRLRARRPRARAGRARPSPPTACCVEGTTAVPTRRCSPASRAPSPTRRRRCRRGRQRQPGGAGRRCAWSASAPTRATRRSSR